MSLTLEIVTPEKQVYSAKVQSALLPTRSGEIEVLPGHQPLLTILVPGEITAVLAENGQRQYLAIDKGFIRVQDDTVSVLAEAAISVANIDPDFAVDAQKRAEEALKRAHEEGADPAEIERLESIAQFSILQQMVVNKRRS